MDGTWLTTGNHHRERSNKLVGRLCSLTAGTAALVLKGPTTYLHLLLAATEQGT